MTPDLPTEQDIMATWRGDPERPEVSICCITYNHAPYIRDALEGFLRQRTDFPFEIIVHDDASSDDTVAIVREYMARYPRLFVPIFQLENQFSQGRKPSVACFQEARAPYLAMCEGDDFWIDDNKLKLQKEILDTNPNTGICSHSIFFVEPRVSRSMVEVDGKVERSETCFPYDLRGWLSNKPRKKLAYTATLMLRKNSVLPFEEFSVQNPKLPYGDMFFRFIALKDGGGVFLNRAMSCYRENSVGSWSEKMKSSTEFKLTNHEERIKGFRKLDAFLDFSEHAVIEQENSRMMSWVLRNTNLPKCARISFFCRTISSLSEWRSRFGATKSLFIGLFRSFYG